MNVCLGIRVFLRWDNCCSWGEVRWNWGQWMLGEKIGKLARVWVGGGNNVHVTRKTRKARSRGLCPLGVLCFKYQTVLTWTRKYMLLDPVYHRLSMELHIKAKHKCSFMLSVKVTKEQWQGQSRSRLTHRQNLIFRSTAGHHRHCWRGLLAQFTFSGQFIPPRHLFWDQNKQLGAC